MTESMSELLGRLKELDPETWRDFKDIIFIAIRYDLVGWLR